MKVVLEKLEHDLEAMHGEVTLLQEKAVEAEQQLRLYRERERRQWLVE